MKSRKKINRKVKEHQLIRLVAKITLANRHGETPWGQAKGKEVW